MTRTLSHREAVDEALTLELTRDPSVIVLGGTGVGGRFPGRVLATPISEAAVVGAAIGAATRGQRPVVAAGSAGLEPIFTRAAQLRDGDRLPVVVRTRCSAPLFTHLPGLKVVVPSSPYEAKGLLIEAIRDDAPVVFCEYGDADGEVPEGSYTIPFGEANVVREGRDVTIVAFGRMVATAAEAAKELAREGVEAEVIDPRTPSPLDAEAILRSVGKTGRLVVADASSPRCNLATDVAALVAKEAFAALKAPIEPVTTPRDVRVAAEAAVGYRS